MRYMISSFIISIIGLCLSGSSCSREESHYVDPYNCNPYEKNPDPIELGSVLIVGRDASGKIYVVDERSKDNEFRVFVSKGDTLIRQEINGGGGGHQRDVGDDYLFLIGYGEDKFTLLVEIPKNGDSRMALVPGDYEGSIDQMGKNGELLTVLDQSVIDTMNLQNFPGVIETEYLATVDNGNSIVVTRPRNDWDYEDFRLFYGNESNMEERRVLEVMRYSDGGSTWIYFKLDNDKVRLYFGFENLSWGDAYLEIGDQQISVTRLHPEKKDLTGLSFFCIQ